MLMCVRITYEICIIFLLQDALILYAKLQLNLTRGGADGSSLVEQLLDVVCKDLDQSNISSTGVPWWVFLFPPWSSFIL